MIDRSLCDEDIPDYELDDLFDEEEIQPQQNKQLVPKPPTYEESLADVLEGKEKVYVDPQHLPPEPQDLPPEYDEDEVPDYALSEEDKIAEILEDLNITNCDNVDKILSQPEMTTHKTRSYLNKVIVNANFRRNQLKGYKAQLTHAYKQGQIGEAERTQENKRIDNARAVLTNISTIITKKERGNKRFWNKKKTRWQCDVLQ